ncbi:2OG-Fe dioxygenase family protein [Roseibium sp. ROS1]
MSCKDLISMVSNEPFIARYNMADWGVSQGEDYEELLAYCSALEPDRYLKHHPCFRFRANCDFVLWNDGNRSIFEPLPNAPFYQSKGINSYLGGIARVYPQYPPNIIDNAIIRASVRNVFSFLPISDEDKVRPWHVGTEVVRIEALPNSEGLPTPEGIHRDGDRYLSIMLLARTGVTGGRSAIYNGDKLEISRFTLLDAFEGTVFDDSKTYHDVTPVRREDGTDKAFRTIFGMSFNYYEDMDNTPSLDSFTP